MRDFKQAADRTQYIIQNADMFTVVKFLGVGKYDRRECPTLEEARALATTLIKNPTDRWMIYAVRGIYDTYVETIKGSA